MASNKVALDFKHFKHVKSDDKSTTLQHKDGHELTLAHKALSPKAQEQLAALAKTTPTANKDMLGDAKRTAEPEERKMFARGGDTMGASAPAVEEPERQPQSDTPAVDPDTQGKREVYNNLVKSMYPADINSNQTERQFGPNGEAPKNFDTPLFTQGEKKYGELKEAKAKDALQTQAAEAAKSEAMQRAGIAVAPPPQAEQPQAAAPETPEQVAAPEVPQAEAPVAQPVAATDPNAIPEVNTNVNTNDPESLLQSGLGSQLSGLKGAASAQSQQAEAEAKSLQENVQAQELAKNTYQQHYDELEKERQAHMSDIQNGYIDPNKYWTGDPATGKGGHSKIASAIGMIIAGFNPTSNPNAATNLLKFQMEQNLESQAKNLGAKENLLSANLRQFGNLRDAGDMTRIMQSDIISNQLKAAAATAASPMAKAAALQAAGKLEADMAPQFQQFAMRRAMMSMADGSAGNDPSDTRAAEHMLGYMRAVNPEMAKDMESRLVPGVGLAKIPVPPNVRSEMITHQALDQAGRALLDYSKTHTNLLPGTAEYNYGVTKAIAFQQKVREGLLGTVFRDSEKPLLEKFVKENPAGALKAFTTQPQLRAILDSNTNSLNTLKQGFGLPAKNDSSASQPVERKTADGKTALFDPSTKKFLGYKK